MNSVIDVVSYFSGSSSQVIIYIQKLGLFRYMIKKVHISDSNKATFVCPECFNTKTVDVTKYKRTITRTKVQSKCACGCFWTSIIERRNRYRLAISIPCICNHMNASGLSESTPMRIADLSASGLRLKPDQNRTIKTGSYSLGDPIMVDFYLEDQNKTHIKKMTYAKHIGESHIGTKFDNSSHGENSTINSYILSHR